MYIHRLAYRHPNGEVEGFVGSCLTAEGAKQSAIRDVCRKCDFTEQPFIRENLIEDGRNLTPEETYVIVCDWKTYGV